MDTTGSRLSNQKQIIIFKKNAALCSVFYNYLPNLTKKGQAANLKQKKMQHGFCILTFLKLNFIKLLKDFLLKIK